jgi:hypothetical protein
MRSNRRASGHASEMRQPYALALIFARRETCEAVKAFIENPDDNLTRPEERAGRAIEKLERLCDAIVNAALKDLGLGPRCRLVFIVLRGHKCVSGHAASPPGWPGAYRIARVPMACHDLAEPAEIADIGERIVYNLRVFNVPVFCESHQVHQIPQRLTKTERAECVFWSPNGVQKWTPAAWPLDRH